MSTKVDESQLSRNDLIAFQTNKQKLFKTTIAIAATYGTVAVVLLIIAMADTNGISGLSTDFLPFTVTLVGGMIVVLILMVIQVVNFAPVAAKIPSLKDNVCPDFWVLQTTPTADAD
jgi:hypothetical protein